MTDRSSAMCVAFTSVLPGIRMSVKDTALRVANGAQTEVDAYAPSPEYDASTDSPDAPRLVDADTWPTPVPSSATTNTDDGESVAGRTEVVAIGQRPARHAVESGRGEHRMHDGSFERGAIGKRPGGARRGTPWRKPAPRRTTRQAPATQAGRRPRQTTGSAERRSSRCRTAPHEPVPDWKETRTGWPLLVTSTTIGISPRRPNVTVPTP